MKNRRPSLKINPLERSIRDSPANQCLSVIKPLEHDLGVSVTQSEAINFDLLLPFLLPQISAAQKEILARQLVLYRRLVEHYSQDGPEEDCAKLREFLESNFGIIAISRQNYKITLAAGRFYNGFDLLASYAQDTRRVFYRLDILKKDLDTHSYSESLMEAVRLLSAYLLFDDDVYDLEDDLAKLKRTVLIDYLERSGNDLRRAVDEMAKILPRLRRLKVANPLLAFAQNLVEIHACNL